MHELSLTEDILSIALERARAVQAKKIVRINLIIGELSGIAEESVHFYFDILSKDSIAAQADLVFRPLLAKLRCRNCTTTFNHEQPVWGESVSFPGMACPNCQSQSIEIAAGHEFYVESIEVE